MKEIEDIVRAYDEARKEGKQTALATVVHVEGSSYRRPGARMLITEDGQLTGMISGGCLEGDALRKALLVMAQQKATLVTYDTTDEDDAKLGIGLGCNGIIHILIEPVLHDVYNNPIQLLKQVISQRQKAVIVTLFSFEKRKAHQHGTCLLQLENGAAFNNFENEDLRSILIDDAQAAFSNQLTSINKFGFSGHHFTSFIEYVKPAVSLIIIGAGNDAIPLSQMASILGWRITIADGRANYATAQRFPLAHQIIVSKPANVLEQVAIDEQTVFVLLTHNYNYDLSILQQLIKTKAVYIGSLGPKKKLERMLDELRDQHEDLPPDELTKIYGPIGLDIGAETAEEIALSILAEIKAVLSNKTPSSLRDRRESIHANHEAAIIYHASFR